MYKFKASKYKNAAPTVAKKDECITEFTVETPVTFGYHAAASAKLVAFCVGTAGAGNVMVLDINAKGRLGNGPYLDAHSDSITAMEFSPFNHCRLATAGADFAVKVWDLPQDGITSPYSDPPVQVFSGLANRPDTLCFHPLAENILAVSCGSMIQICNVEDGKIAFELDTGCDLIQSMSWNKIGTTIAITTKDHRLMICDPRSGKVMSEVKAHGNHKETKVVWLGEKNKVATTGFSNNRTKELKVWEVGSGNLTCLQTEEFGSGTGVLMPFYDEDTGMLFVAAKGDSSMTFLEFEDGKDPPVKLASQKILQNQTKGMCMLPKLGVDAASCEVNRLFQLTQKMLVPVPWKVPRKSLRDFPIDLFPDTASDYPVLAAQEWIDGGQGRRTKTPLDPSKKKPLRLQTGASSGANGAQQSSPAQNNGDVEQPEAKSYTNGSGDTKQMKKATKEKEASEKEPTPVQPKYKPFTGVRKSKFRHWKARFAHPSTNITNVDSVSLSVLTTSDAMRCSGKYAAVPVKGPGGLVAITELSKPGRMTDENTVTIQNSSGVTDMKWNPFDESEISIALDSWSVKVWKIPQNKYGKTLEEASLEYKDHDSKPLVLCYHPLAENVMASAEAESRILIWNVKTGETYFELSGGTEEVMSIAWSISGKFLAAHSKDKKLRIYEPRKKTEPKQIGPGPEGTRSSRLVWACDDKFIAVSGFERASCRMVSLHSVSDLKNGPVACEEYDTSPAVMILHYDADSSTLFFTSKGDTTMQSLEISEKEPPHLFRLASFTSDSPFQSISFLPKKTNDPKIVEFAQAWALTKSSLQKLSFTLPRVKMEYFQDDVLPPTPIVWEKTMSATEWVKGSDKTPRKLDLRPKGMPLLSEAPPDEVKPKKFESYDASTYKTDEEKKEELLEAMSGKLDLDKELEQDTMEGVDDDEWDDY